MTYCHFDGAYNSNNDFVSSKDIIQWNITIDYWQKVGDGTGVQGDDAHVYTIKAINGSIVIGGHFTEVGGTEAYAVAKWDGLSWEALDGPNSSDVPGVNGAVFAIEIVGNKIYVGGLFFNADNVPVANIAVWDGNDWSGLGNGLNNIFNSIMIFNYCKFKERVMKNLFSIRHLMLVIIFTFQINSPLLAQSDFEGKVKIEINSKNETNVLNYFKKGNSARIEVTADQQGVMIFKPDKMFMLLPDKKVYM